MSAPTDKNHNLMQNVAVIAVELHMHHRFTEFYETCGDAINGFVGAYDLAIGMAEALSDWENDHGGAFEAYDAHDLDWINTVEAYTNAVINLMIETESAVNFRFILRELPALSHSKAPAKARGRQ
ncbi:MAG: hypothetical protein ACREJM_05845 [Candidatus Saccharimonadales bacterium]